MNSEPAINAPDPGHDVNRTPRALKAAATRERRNRVWELHLTGIGVYAIAKALQITIKSVEKHIARGEELAQREHVRDLVRMRATELARLNKLLSSLWKDRADPRVADTILRVIERRAKLLGLDAPLKAELSGRVEIDERPRFDPAKLDSDKLRTLQALIEEGLVQQALDVTPQVSVLALPVQTGQAAKEEEAT